MSEPEGGRVCEKTASRGGDLRSVLANSRGISKRVSQAPESWPISISLCRSKVQRSRVGFIFGMRKQAVPEARWEGRSPGRAFGSGALARAVSVSFASESRTSWNSRFLNSSSDRVMREEAERAGRTCEESYRVQSWFETLGIPRPSCSTSAARWLLRNGCQSATGKYRSGANTDSQGQASCF